MPTARGDTSVQLLPPKKLQRHETRWGRKKGRAAAPKLMRKDHQKVKEEKNGIEFKESGTKAGAQGSWESGAGEEQPQTQRSE